MRNPRLNPSLDSSGQGLTEYIILLMLVAVVSIGVVNTLGDTVKKKIEQAKEQINSKVTWN